MDPCGDPSGMQIAAHFLSLSSAAARSALSPSDLFAAMARGSTGQIAEVLGIPSHCIGHLVRDRKISPAKGPAGAIQWTRGGVFRTASPLRLSVTEVSERLAQSQGGRP